MPLVDLSSQISDGAEQLAGPFGSLFRRKQFPSSYEFGKRFVSTYKTTSGGGNGVTSIDDPTYLGFSLIFDITSPLFQGAFIGNTEPPELPLEENPFGSAIQSLQELGLTGPTSSQSSNAGFTSNASQESAVSYLETIGEETRATYLRAFIQGIQEINTTRPYYWQTISGLTEAWEKSLDMMDPYTGSKDNEGIEIGCLEALDLKISALFSLYKMAVYDVRYKRFILPENLLNFDVYVYVQEIRKFQTSRGFLRALNQSLNPYAAEDDTVKYINENTSQIGFKFSMCNFLPQVSGKVFDIVTNAGGNTVASTSMKWSYSNVEMVSQFSGYNSKLFETQRQQPKSPFNFEDAAKKFGKDIINNASENAISTVQRSANSLLSRLRFGNAFGISVDNAIGAISNPQILLNAANGAAVQLLSLSSNNTPKGPSLGDNPLGEGVEPGNTISTERIFPTSNNNTEFNSSNVFGQGPSGPPPLESTNVFE